MFVSYLMIFGSIYVYYGQEYGIDLDSFTTLIKKIKKISDKKDPDLFLLYS